MDFILEFLITLVIEGAFESLTEKKVPMFIRVTVAVLLLTFYLGLGILFIYLGIINKSGLLIGIAIFLLVMVAIAAISKYLEIKKKH